MDAVPETFVDTIGEISFKQGMIRIELVSLSGPEPRVSQRLITSLQAFQQQPAPEAEPAPERGGVVAAVRRLARIEPVPQPASPPALVSEPAPRPVTELGPPRSPNFSDD